MFPSRRRRPQSVSRHQRLARAVLRLETLEDRLAPAVITVTSLDDNLTADGQVTLREAIKAANEDSTVDGVTGDGADTIQFDAGLFTNRTATITLSATPINDASSLGASAFAIATDVTIQGPAATGETTDDHLTISRSGSAASFRFATVSTSGDLKLSNFTVSGFEARGGKGADGSTSTPLQGGKGGGGGGAAGLGGAILNLGALRIEGVTLTANLAQGGNGGQGHDTSTGGTGGGGGGLGGDGSGTSGGGPNGGSSDTSGTLGGGGGGDSSNSGSTVAGAGGLGGGGGGGFGGGPGTVGGAGGFGGGGGGGGKGSTTGPQYLAGADGGLAGFGAGMGQSGDGRQTVSTTHGSGGGGAGMGGAIFNLGGTVTVINSTLTANSAVGGTRGPNGRGTPGQSSGVASSFTDSQTGYNAAAGDGTGMGGAIFSLNGTLTVINATISENVLTSANPSSSGRAVYVYSGNPGGGYSQSSTSATVSLLNAILGQADAATPDYQSFGSVSESGTNNLIRNNVRVPVTTLTASPSAPDTTTLTIASASALGTVEDGTTVLLIDAEQVLVTAGAGTTSLTVTRGHNSTLAAQHSNTARVFNLTDASQTSFTGGVLNNDDPLLGALTDNGGPTPTMLPDDASPAIGEGTTQDAPTVDQRGERRGSSVNDVGAVQVTPGNLPPEITSDGGGDTAELSVAENTTAVTTVTATVEQGETLSFELLSGDDADLFAITQSGELTFEDAPNFESPTGGDNVYVVTVRVSDGDLTDQQQITVTVTDANDAPEVTSQTFTIDETLGNGETVGTVQASDEDDDTLTYAITDGNESGAFTIDSTTGVITVADTTQLDYETTTSFTLTVTATDDDSNPLTDSGTITIELTEVNEPPVIEDQTLGVAEDSTVGDVVGTVQASDPEDPITYAITGGSGQGLFEIDADTGEVTVATGATFDAEGGTTSYTLDVTVTEVVGGGGGGGGSGTLLLFEAFDYDTATLNDANGGVGWANNWGVRTTNNEADDQNGSFHYVAGSPNAPTNHPNDPFPELYTIDYPAGTAANLTATGGSAWRWQNAGGQFYERRDFAATFGDAEGAVTRWMSFLIAPVMTIDHGGFSGIRLIATDSATAKDGFVGWGGGANAWQVGAFATGGTNATGKPGPEDADLAVGTNNDTKAAPTFLVVKMEFDGGTGADTLSLWVNPTAAELEGAADAVYNQHNLGSFTGMYLQGNYGSVKDEIRIGTDLSNVIGGGSSPKSSEATVTVTVTDVNDQSPTLDDTSFSLEENSASGTEVGTVSGSDRDATAPNNVLSYAIVGGNDSGAFAIDSTTGVITVADASKIDYETATSFALTVEASDGGSPALSDTATVTIAVGDANETPTADDGSFSVDENSASGTQVGTVSASDPDTTAPNNELSYAITAGNTDGVFAIDATTGVISVTGALNFETTASYSLTVEVSDGGNLNDTATVVVGVNDVNEKPTADDASFSVNENSASGTQVGTVSASDPDTTAPNNELSYAITAGNTDGVFAIDATTGVISVDGAPNFETTASYSLTVEVSDGGNLKDTATVVVGINDVNEKPTADDASFSVNENSASGTQVGTVSASDPDTTAPNKTLSYAITAGNTDGAFAIDSTTGVISVTGALNFETISSYSLTVEVTDGGNLKDTAAVTVAANDLNEAPSVSDASFSIDENSASGTTVGTVSASDPDTTAPNKTLSYAITGGNESGAIAIDATTGVISVADASLFDFETTASFSLTVEVTDGGNLKDTAAVVVSVNDVNEKPTADDGSFSVNENSASGTTVGTVTASDPDTTAPNKTLSYAITAGNTGGVFAIDSTTGKITVAGALNFEATASYSLTVEASDGGGLKDTATVTVAVNDVIEGSDGDGGGVGTLTGFVYEDSNSNGQFDAGEQGMGGRTVFLDDNGNGQFDAGETSTLSDGGGAYRFDNVPAGDHDVVVQLFADDSQRLITVTVTGGQTTATDVAVKLGHVGVVVPDNLLTLLDGGDGDVTLSSDPATAYVQGLYLSILGRDADAGGLQNFLALLDSGVSTQTVVDAIVSSNEARAMRVQEAYRSILGREAEQGGLQNWVAFLQAGNDVNDLAVALLTSDEFAGSHDPATILARVYEVVLGRQASATEIQSQLGQGFDLARTIQGILASGEARTRILDVLYSGYLGRSADEGGVQGFLTLFQAGADVEDVTEAFLDSDEFQAILASLGAAPPVQTPNLGPNPGTVR